MFALSLTTPQARCRLQRSADRTAGSLIARRLLLSLLKKKTILCPRLCVAASASAYVSLCLQTGSISRFCTSATLLAFLPSFCQAHLARVSGILISRLENCILKITTNREKELRATTLRVAQLILGEGLVNPMHVRSLCRFADFILRLLRYNNCSILCLISASEY
jgi:hypothetical protein